MHLTRGPAKPRNIKQNSCKYVDARVACHDASRSVGNVPNSMSGVSRFQSMGR